MPSLLTLPAGAEAPRPAWVINPWLRQSPTALIAPFIQESHMTSDSVFFPCWLACTLITMNTPAQVVLPYRAHNRQIEEPTHDSYQRILNYLTSRLECALLTFLAQPPNMKAAAKSAWASGVHTELVCLIGLVGYSANILTHRLFSAWLCPSSATPLHWDHSRSFLFCSARWQIPCSSRTWENLFCLPRSRAYC